MEGQVMIGGRRRRAGRIMGALFAAVVLNATAIAAKPRLNVLMIMTDDLNCNLGCYDHPLVQTPHIDRLASEGLLFRNAFCNFPLCGPSRASFMTGLYPRQNGVTKLRRYFRDYTPDAVTLPQHFQANGYLAIRVGKIYHYDNPKGIGTNSHDDAPSWDVRVSPIGRDKAEEDKIFSLNPGSFGASLSWLAADGEDEEQTDGKVATESIRALEALAKTRQPFFLAVGFYKPHTPYVAPKKYFDLYDLDDIEVPKTPTGYLKTLPEPAAKSIRRRKREIDLPEDTAKQAIRAYYAAISFVDAQVGRVLEALERTGLRDNTVILFSSDHGYHMGEHGYYQKTTLFENADQVPLIISTPGMSARGRQTFAVCEMIDFYRTLSELAGLPEPPAYVRGVSLAPVLNNPSLPGRGSAMTELENGFTIRTRRYRFTRWNIDNPNRYELYDRLSDPAEMHNLASDPVYANVRASLEPRLERRVKESQAAPAGLHFIPPKPDDKGYSLAQTLEMGWSDDVHHTFPGLPK